MSVLRLFCTLATAPTRCAWVLFDEHADVQSGEGALAQLPQGATQVQCVLAASDVLLVRVQLPAAGRRRSAALLAYAAEEKLASDPDANQVSPLGRVDDDDVLAVLDRQRLQGWCDALAAAGVHVDGVYCETLMLPVQEGEWSLAWNGQEGFVRTGEFGGGAMDCGDPRTPPLALQLLLDAARARDVLPSSIALYLATPVAQPDLDAWQHGLGVEVRLMPALDWRLEVDAAGIRLDRERQRWRPAAATLAPWRQVGWMVLVVVMLHSTALLVDHLRLTSQQQQLRQQMDARFRALFPTAVAVVDPVLQTRRQLTEARHAANQPDDGDFPVMLGKVTAALAGVPAAELHALSYADGRMTLEFSATANKLASQIETRLLQSGLAVDVAKVAGPAKRGTFTLTLRSS